VCVCVGEHNPTQNMQTQKEAELSERRRCKNHQTNDIALVVTSFDTRANMRFTSRQRSVGAPHWLRYRYYSRPAVSPGVNVFTSICICYF